MAQWQADAAAADPAILDLTLAAYFDHRAFPAPARREVLSWWSISGSTDPAVGRVSQLLSPKLARGWAQRWMSWALPLPAGSRAWPLAAAQASGAAVVLSDPAERLTHGPEGVRLRLASGRELRAKAALVALPVNALAQLRFDPALPAGPARVRANGHAGRVVKLMIRARGVAPGHLVAGEGLGPALALVRPYPPRWIDPDHRLRPCRRSARPQCNPCPRRTGDGLPGCRISVGGLARLAGRSLCARHLGRPSAADEPLYAPDIWTSIGPLAFAGSDIGPGNDQGWFEGALASAERAVAALAHGL